MAGVEAAVLADRLHPDLRTLLESVGVPVVETVPVTTMPPPDDGRACFRVTFADGQVLKARHLRTPADVDRVTRLLPLLDPRSFPPVLAHHGRALLTCWIPGGSIERRGWTSARLRACGRLQAELHRVVVPGDLAPLRRRPLHWEEQLDGRLGELVGRRILASREAREIRRLVAAAAPPSESAGLCHTDFCDDNIILTDDGQVCVVDNEGITVDAREYDLARTWYRWPMTPSQQQAYAEGYGAHEHAARFAAHFLHWALIVVVESAALRTRAGSASARVPLERLRQLLRTRGRHEALPRLLRSR